MAKKELGTSEKRYLALFEQVLTDIHRIDRKEQIPVDISNYGFKGKLLVPLQKLLRKKSLEICKVKTYDRETRENGLDWPSYAETMIGLKRLVNIKECLLKVISDDIEGDLIETGVWRGGSTIYMKAILSLFNENERVVWVADSFEGLPKPDPKYVDDVEDAFHSFDELKISEEEVLNNFRKYDLLDNNVKTLKGWFKDTLPSAPIEKLALLRLDGDMYESTMDALVNLYPKLSIGGFIIIDDFGDVKGCKMAVEDYRKKEGIEEEIVPIDFNGVYWRKQVQN